MEAVHQDWTTAALRRLLGQEIVDLEEAEPHRIVKTLGLVRKGECGVLVNKVFDAAQLQETRKAAGGLETCNGR